MKKIKPNAAWKSAAGILTALLFVLGSGLSANTGTPVGTWRTIDDETGNPRSIVRIEQRGNQLIGTIQDLIREPGEDPNPLCTECSGARKDQPIRGMRIIWGVTGSGAEWSGGRILDPASGNEYRVNLTVTDGGSRLQVRGYMGISALGRTQTWHRVN